MLINTPVSQMLRGEDWESGKGVQIHLSIAAVLVVEPLAKKRAL
jgi:hypothetical protein